MAQLQTQMMRKETVMNKQYTSIFLITMLFASQSCRASEATSADNQTTTQVKNSPKSTYNPRKVHDTSLGRKLTDIYYCDSHILETNLTLRREIAADDWFFNVDIDASLDGKPLDFGMYLAKINNSTFQTDVAVQYNCINSQITISIYLDQGTGDAFATRVGEFHVDLDTGELLPEPRRSPKK